MRHAVQSSLSADAIVAEDEEEVRIPATAPSTAIA
jgi:hypothetical protein